MSHDIFISYSRKNLAIVKPVKEELEAKGFRCWMDLSGIPSGTESFIDKIIPAIEEARLCLLFIMTTESQASEYALKEIGFAKNYAKKRVVLVRLNDDAMEKKFFFNYQLSDIIDWRAGEQKSKLLRDLGEWKKEFEPGWGEEDRASGVHGEDEAAFAEAYAAYEKHQYAQSFPVFSSLAERGFARAFGYLGLAYELGEGVAQDREQAVSWYEKAIEAREHVGVYRLGMLYRKTGRDDLAFRVYKTAADGGWATGEDHLHLGEMLEKGKGTRRDFVRAAEHYRIAMNSTPSPFDKRSAREGLERLGELYGPEDFEVELPQKLRRATPEALYEMGEKNNDDFDAPDKPLAFACYKEAAEKGHALAACRLAKMYADRSLPIHDQKMADKYGAIASEGMVELCRETPELADDAGYAYQCGLGCPKDAAKAKTCYLIGAENDDKDCLWRLGSIFQDEGRGEDAFRHFLKAAELGQGMAMFEVAQCFEKGQGTKRDRNQAGSWYRRCVKSNYAASHDAEWRLRELSEEPD